MTIFALVVTILVLGVVAWAIQAYVPMEARIKNFLMFVLLAIAVVIALAAFGILPMNCHQNVPRIG